MKILQCSDSFLPIVDGVGRVVYNYAATLGQMGHESYVCAPMADAGYRGGWPFELVDFWGAPVPGSPQYSMGLPVLDKHYHARMSRIKPDLVHAHSPFLLDRRRYAFPLNTIRPLWPPSIPSIMTIFIRSPGGMIV